MELTGVPPELDLAATSPRKQDARNLFDGSQLTGIQSEEGQSPGVPSVRVCSYRKGVPNMAEPKPPSQPVQPTHRGHKFSEMQPKQKFIWILKVIACVLTFGFAFPAVMED